MGKTNKEVELHMSTSLVSGTCHEAKNPSSRTADVVRMGTDLFRLKK